MASLEEREHQKDLDRVRNFRLMDDDFMTICFEGHNECTELVLRIVLGKELSVVSTQTQVFMENLSDRSLRLDILASDADGKYYDIEIQRSDRGAWDKRARYHSSMMDARLLDKGADFDALPETYIIFITENDVRRGGLPLYHIERVVHETGELFKDDEHIIYVNGAYRGADAIGKLMHDFSCADPAQMNYPVLADRTRFYKESKEGVETMCRAMEEMRNESLNRGIAIGETRGIAIGETRGEEKKGREVANSLLADGFSVEKAAKHSGLSIEEVQKLQAERISK